jgi:hypothetical protein
LSQDGSTLERDKRGEEKKPDADDDNVYRLLRGAPTLIVARSNMDVADYRPRWIRNDRGCVEGLGYENEPPSPRPLEAIQSTFFTSLMMKSKKGGDEYVPVRLRGGADDSGSDSSESPDVIPPEPTPKFKVGDRVIWKRRLQDNHIHGTGTITLVARQPPLVHSLTGVAYNHFCYEIDAAALKEPGIEGQVSENLIRPIIPPAGSWREYVESLGSPQRAALSLSSSPLPLDKRRLSPRAPSSSKGISASREGSPKFKHQKIEKDKGSANEKRLNRSNKFDKEVIDDDWSAR